MNLIVLLLGLLVLPSILGNRYDCNIPSKGTLNFPANFSFGVSTSAYQIEGGWNENGKGMSIWDDFTHNNPALIKDGLNGDMTADSYHRFDDDLKILKELKVNHYRFSISWSRIFPTGKVSHRNQDGIDYYNNVIDKLLANGITPLVTMHHFDTPLAIERRGGFTSILSVEYFANYAIEIFELFGDRVKNWITFNEPWFMCKRAYGDALYPPLINISGIADYICIDNILKAHGAAYRIYKSKFFPKQKGRVGISISTPYFILTNPSEKDVLERALQFNVGFLAHPIFSKHGGYPESMVKNIAENSLEEGRLLSRLPILEGEWRNIIKGSADFFGLNYYSSTYLKQATEPVGRNPSFERDTKYEAFNRGTQRTCDPKGLEGLLKWIRKEYNNIPVIITENGFADQGEIRDDKRVNYLKSHLQAVLNALDDGCNVIGYTHWSMIDNFEWLFGYTIKYGLYSVNFTSPTKERHPKKSAHYYKRVILSKRLQNIDS